MPRSSNPQGVPEAKAPVAAMSEDRKREIVAQLTDDVLSKLTGAFFDVCKIERWTKRDLATISGINETAIGHILAGRRKNLTVETIALLTRAMGTRPELVLHETRAAGNHGDHPSIADTPLMKIASMAPASNTAGLQGLGGTHKTAAAPQTPTDYRAQLAGTK
ncbi:plasmid maintenance system antidote protein VapI [Bradyrhizobium elkanii]